MRFGESPSSASLLMSSISSVSIVSGDTGYFSVQSSPASVAAGAATGTLTIPVIDDGLLEAVETVIASISNPSNPDVSITTAQATLSHVLAERPSPVAIGDPDRAAVGPFGAKIWWFSRCGLSADGRSGG